MVSLRISRILCSRGLSKLDLNIKVSLLRGRSLKNSVRGQFSQSKPLRFGFSDLLLLSCESKAGGFWRCTPCVIPKPAVSLSCLLKSQGPYPPDVAVHPISEWHSGTWARLKLRWEKVSRGPYSAQKDGGVLGSDIGRSYWPRSHR